nr:MAG: hypothetical protein E4H34_01700 [Hyphomicrobiales bacterium]
MMRFIHLMILAGATFVSTIAPAQTQWRPYVSRDLGFAFHAPGQPSVERGTYRADTSGEYPTIVYRTIVNNIEYKVIVADCRNRAAEGASILEEAAYTFQLEQNVVTDDYGRVDTVYGRKVTIDLPDNGGRSMASFYFDRGYLFEFVATVLPANGDYGSPSMSRFIDSHSFAENRVEPDATELQLPN